MTILQIGTKDYDTDVVLVKKALSQLETLVHVYNGYAASEPSSLFGWRFFKVSFGAEFQEGIERKFDDMLRRYRWEKPESRFAKFMQDYFQARGCDVKVKLAKN